MLCVILTSAKLALRHCHCVAVLVVRRLLNETPSLSKEYLVNFMRVV